MKIKHENGVVTFRMKTGRDFVRNTMPIGQALAMFKKSNNTVKIGNEVCVDDTYYFPLTEETTEKVKDVSEKRKKRCFNE